MNESPPAEPEISKLIRHILVEKPRVTKFQIEWDNELGKENNMNGMNGMSE